MFYNLLVPYSNKFHVANLFHYTTFRSMISVLVSLGVCLLIGSQLIASLKSLQRYGQPIREDGPESHKSKAGTPTMGGLMIIISVIISTILIADLNNPYTWILLFIMIGFGGIGFIDDYVKIAKNNTKGISGKSKMLIQILVSLIGCIMIQYFAQYEGHNNLTFPFFKNLVLDLGIFYVPFAMFVVVGSSNAVNLTDGLDGLAVVPIALVAGSFGVISYLVGNSFYASYLQIMYVPAASELSVFCGALLGGSLGFLWFNAQPAEIFMGDTGSLSLGAVLGSMAVITKHEIVLSIIGGVFVIETLSVIIQVYYFKFSGGKRFFKMAPLHHHFEKHGWLESKVVVRFWIMAVIFALIGLSSMKLR